MRRYWERVTFSIDREVLEKSRILATRLGYTSFSRFIEDLLYGLLVYSSIFSVLFKRLGERERTRRRKHKATRVLLKHDSHE